MDAYKRTVTCGELTAQRVGETVTLNGWVHRKRDHGGVHFINLRDRYGVTQTVVDEQSSPELAAVVKQLRYEFCIALEGTVQARPGEMVNPNMTTGEIEVHATHIEILSTCKPLPFMIEDDKTDAREDLRLSHRYLDLRSGAMQRYIALRHKFAYSVREFYNSRGFYEIETPTFIRSTPEGARDFLVPSRLHKGKFYALPQSPQLYKQLLMVSGFDKYFQIARCYRDEDARGDRQLEFTQVDVERSFVSQDDILTETEELFKYTFEQTIGYKVETPFVRLSYQDAMERFGTDKPDLRFGMELQDFSTFAAKSDFQAFRGVLESGGASKALVVKGCAEYSRKQIDQLEAQAKIHGAKGLAWTKVQEGEFQGGVARFFQEQYTEICKALKAEVGDLILMGADTWKRVSTYMGAVRTKLGEDLELTDPKTFAFCWIVDFPLFEENDEGGWNAVHHMFTMPHERFIDSMEENPGEVLGQLYDLVINGNEIASGSIRVHDPEIQSRIFSIVGFSKEEARARFGFLLEAFSYGPPPHGGIAPGLDRTVMLMVGEKTIKEVIPFPKATSGICPMVEAPAEVDAQQLEDLHIQIAPDKEEA